MAAQEAHKVWLAERVRESLFAARGELKAPVVLGVPDRKPSKYPGARDLITGILWMVAVSVGVSWIGCLIAYNAGAGESGPLWLWIAIVNTLSAPFAVLLLWTIGAILDIADANQGKID